MRLGFFVNNVRRELAAYTTTRLALTATNRGDEVWYFGAAGFHLRGWMKRFMPRAHRYPRTNTAVKALPAGPAGAACGQKTGHDGRF